MTHAGPFAQDTENTTTGSSSMLLGTAPPKLSLWYRIFGLAGTAQPIATSEPDFEPPKVDEPRIGGAPETGVWVTKPARTPLEAFKDTISEGTRLFCEQNVHPLYVEDHQTKFRVTGIKMYVPKGDSKLSSILEELPIDVRNRLARLRAQSAPGAAEQLVFDEGFFGISIDIEPTVIEGQQIRLIAAWSGGNVDIKMVFTGQYITVKTKPQPSALAENTVPVSGNLADATTDTPEPSTPSTTPQVAQPAIPVLPAMAKPTNTLPPLARHSKDTPLGLPPRAQKSGTETPMSSPADSPIGRIHLLPYGAQQETVLSITANMLPFMLGREHTCSERFTHGYSLASDSDEAVARLVSREHFELNHFERDEGRFYVINHAVDKNGSFHNGCTVPERFSFKAQSPRNVFTLGGSEGEGTVRVVIEAV